MKPSSPSPRLAIGCCKVYDIMPTKFALHMKLITHNASCLTYSVVKKKKMQVGESLLLGFLISKSLILPTSTCNHHLQVGWLLTVTLFAPASTRTSFLSPLCYQSHRDLTKWYFLCSFLHSLQHFWFLYFAVEGSSFRSREAVGSFLNTA